MKVRRGELVAVVGGVGSGKSMLLQSMLGETANVTGRYAGVKRWVRGHGRLIV